MTALVELLLAVAAGPFIGTRYGHRLTWRRGRTRLGRLVWTTGAVFVDGCPVYMPVIGKPPADSHRHEIQVSKPTRARRTAASLAASAGEDSPSRSAGTPGWQAEAALTHR